MAYNEPQNSSNGQSRILRQTCLSCRVSQRDAIAACSEEVPDADSGAVPPKVYFSLTELCLFCPSTIVPAPNTVPDSQQILN